MFILLSLHTWTFINNILVGHLLRGCSLGNGVLKPIEQIPWHLFNKSKTIWHLKISFRAYSLLTISITRSLHRVPILTKNKDQKQFFVNKTIKNLALISPDHMVLGIVSKTYFGMVLAQFRFLTRCISCSVKFHIIKRLPWSLKNSL